MPDVLEKCAMKGSDLQPPFTCPSDIFLPTRRLDNSKLPYRQTGFLSVYEQVRRWGIPCIRFNVGPKPLNTM